MFTNAGQPVDQSQIPMLLLVLLILSRCMTPYLAMG